MYEFRASQVVQDFVHQPYENTHKHQNCVVDSQAHETNSYKLWTVPWLMATQGEVLDTVKSIQVAFWSFANHLCGLQSSASYPLKSRPLGVWVKPNVYDGWEQGATKLRGQISNIPHSGKSLKSKLFIFIMIIYTLVWSCLAVWQCPRTQSNLTLYIIHTLITILAPKTWSTIRRSNNIYPCSCCHPYSFLCDMKTYRFLVCLQWNNMIKIGIELTSNFKLGLPS